MARVVRRWIAGLVLAGTVLAGGYWLWGPERLAGTLVAGLGDTIAEVAACSSYPLNTAILQDNDMSAADRPVLFRYAGPGGFELPPTRAVALNSTATVVTGIEMAPQLEYLGRDGVLVLARDIERRLLAAGWTRDLAAPNLTAWDDLPHAMADPSKPERMAWHIAIFRYGDMEVLFRLSRRHGRWPGLPNGAFLLNLLWNDEPLDQDASAVMYRLRLEDGVSRKLWRSVDAAAYSARVRALLPR